MSFSNRRNLAPSQQGGRAGCVAGWVGGRVGMFMGGGHVCKGSRHVITGHVCWDMVHKSWGLSGWGLSGWVGEEA